MLRFGLLKRASARLPRSGLLVHAKRFDPTILKIADKMGDSRRTIQDLQYCQCDGTGYFAGTLTGSESWVSKQGTAAVTFASGRMNVGAGTLWSVVLSNGSRYEFATRTGTTSALLMDVSGNGRHLVATSFADIAALCATSKVQGSDYCNTSGWSAGGLGPELVTTNRDFSAWSGDNPVGWTVSGELAGTREITQSSSGARFWATDASSFGMYRSIGLTAGLTYRATVNVGSVVSGSLKLQTSGGALLYTLSTIGEHAFDFAPDNASVYIYRLAANSDVTISNISVRLSIPSTGIVPARTDNPALDALGNAVQYPGRARYDVNPVGAACAAFNGTSDYIELAQLPNPSTNFSISFKWYADSTVLAYNTIFSITNSTWAGEDGAIALQRSNLYNALDLIFYPVGGSRVVVTPLFLNNVYDNTWKDVALSFSNGTYNLTINGVSVTGSYTVFSGFNTTKPVRIGRIGLGSVYSKMQMCDLNINGVQFNLTESAGTTVYGYNQSTGQVYTGTLTTADLTAFWAGRQDTFFPGLQYGCNIGRWSPVDRAYKDEVTRTNKCTCVKANPTATTNLIKSGDAASVLSVVNDSAALAAAGLSHVCTSGKVYKLDNSAGSVSATATIGLSSDLALVPCVFTAYVRTSAGTGGLLGFESNTTFTASSGYLVKSHSATPTTGNRPAYVRANAGAVIYFILPQLEEGSTATSPIIGADTAAAATEYNGQWPANPLTPGLDCRGNALTNPPLVMNRSASYQLQGPEVFAAMGEGDFWNADGTAKTLTYDQWVAAGVGDQVFVDPSGLRGGAIYSTVQVDPALSKVKKYTRLS